MSATNLLDNALQARLRDKLKVEGVKLWLSPFYKEDEKIPNDDEILALGHRYAQELEQQSDEVIISLYQLQRNAIERLEERDNFHNTGLATLRIKYSGTSPGNVRLQMNLVESTGLELRKLVAELLNVTESRIKLISSGHVIVDDQSLETQGVKNGGSILALFLGDSNAFQTAESGIQLMQELKASAELLASKDRDNAYALQVTDQTGKTLDLPESEKTALAIALALHDKGRKCMKGLEFSQALIFLLEADSVYMPCQSGVLDMVDNYGMLHLDIAWCYLCLQNIAELPAVEERLAKSERALHKSYGRDMERVIALKGSNGWESALFVRLHLLQGITAYHLGHIEQSKMYIQRVQNEIQRLRVSDDQLADMLNMGYEESDARMALRVTFGNIQAAVEWLSRTKEEKSKNKKEEAVARKRRKLEKALGTCNNGDQVNATLFENLQTMGFSPILSIAALKEANNDIDAAVQLIADPSFAAKSIPLILPTASNAAISSNLVTESALAVVSEMANRVAALGPEAMQAIAPEALQILDNAFTRPSESSNDITETPQDFERTQKAYENLSNEMAEDEYIDLSLAAEMEFLDQYKSYLNM